MYNDYSVFDYQMKIIEYHVFHDHINEVFNHLCSYSVIKKTIGKFMPLIRIERPNKENPPLFMEEKDIITFDIGNDVIKQEVVTVNKKGQQYLVKIKTLNCPSNISPYFTLYHFIWDTTTQTTLFRAEYFIEDTRYKTNIFSLMKRKTVLPYDLYEKIIRKSIKSMEEAESISIKTTFDLTWAFVASRENLTYFFLMEDIKVEKEEDDVVKIIDGKQNNQIRLRWKEIKEEDKVSNELRLEYVDSSIPMPKQIIKIRVVEVKKNLTLMLFNHTILEYVPYDSLFENKKEKKKILKKIKIKLEEEAEGAQEKEESMVKKSDRMERRNSKVTSSVNMSGEENILLGNISKFSESGSK